MSILPFQQDQMTFVHQSFIYQTRCSFNATYQQCIESKEASYCSSFIKVPLIDFYINIEAINSSYEIPKRNSSHLWRRTFLTSLNYFHAITEVSLEKQFAAFYIKKNKPDYLLNGGRVQPKLNKTYFYRNLKLNSKPYVCLVFQESGLIEFKLETVIVSRRILMECCWLTKDYVIKTLTDGFKELFGVKNYGTNTQKIVSLITNGLKEKKMEASIELEDSHVIQQNKQLKEAKMKASFLKFDTFFALIIEANQKWELKKNDIEIQYEYQISDSETDNIKQISATARTATYRKKRQNETSLITLVQNVRNLKKEKWQSKFREILRNNYNK